MGLSCNLRTIRIHSCTNCSIRNHSALTRCIYICRTIGWKWLHRTRAPAALSSCPSNLESGAITLPIQNTRANNTIGFGMLLILQQNHKSFVEQATVDQTSAINRHHFCVCFAKGSSSCDRSVQNTMFPLKARCRLAGNSSAVECSV